MKKFYMLLLFIGVLATSFKAAAAPVNFTLRVADASAVTVEISYTAYEITDGDNAISVDAYSSVAIKAKGENFLLSVTDLNAEVGSYDRDKYVSNMMSCSFYPSSSTEGHVIEVITQPASELRTGSVKVTVDDASKVSLQRMGTSSMVTLVDGENTVTYIPEKETQLQISSSAGATVPLYSVTVGGEPIAPRGNVFYVNMPSEAIDIKANFPDKDCKVTFTLSEGAEGFLTSVKDANDNELTITDNSLTVKAGDVIYLTGDLNNYGLDTYAVNGMATSFSNPQRVAVIDDTEISITAHKYASFNVVVNIDNVENVKAYRGQKFYDDQIEFASGENTIEMNEQNNVLSFCAAEDCYIVSVTANGEPVEPNYNGDYVVSCAEGTVIDVTSAKIVRDLKAAVYVDFDPSTLIYFSFYNNSSSANIPLTQGYNFVDFYSGDNPFILSCYGSSSDPKVYVNNEEVTKGWQGFSMNFEDGAVAKIFLEEPAKYTVTFDIEGDATKFVVTTDQIVPVTYYEIPMTVMQGTNISVAAASADDKIEVSVNGEPLAAQDGIYSFVPVADSALKIKVDGSGVEDIVVDKDSSDVYNLQGVMLRRNASADQIDALPAGTYIIGGKKIYKK